MEIHIRDKTNQLFHDIFRLFSKRAIAKNLIKSKLNEEEMLKNMVDFETNKQLEQFSLIYFNKIKLNAQIDEL